MLGAEQLLAGEHDLPADRAPGFLFGDAVKQNVEVLQRCQAGDRRNVGRALPS
jgi:hypothetical protein